MLPPRSQGVHGEAEAAEREATLLLEQAAKLPTGSEWAVEASEQAGVALARRDRLRAAANALPPLPPPIRTSRHWEWFAFERGRLMAPMLSHPAEGGASLDSQRRHLAGFEVFGGVPVDQWLRLEALCSQETDDARDRDGTGGVGTGGAGIRTGGGAAVARQLQADLFERLPCVAQLDDPRCVFHQFQWLERGTAVASHVDAPEPPAEVVATLALSPGGEIRVGPARFSIEPGDVYAIGGSARWDVTHEVRASTADRLSLTLRYAPRSMLDTQAS